MKKEFVFTTFRKDEINLLKIYKNLRFNEVAYLDN